MIMRIHIERLVLDGLPLQPGQGALVQEALEAELSRLLTADGLDQSLRVTGLISQVSGGGISLTSPSDPAYVGRKIAEAVYGGIGE